MGANAASTVVLPCQALAGDIDIRRDDDVAEDGIVGNDGKLMVGGTAEVGLSNDRD